MEKVTRHRVYSQLSGSHPRKSVRTRIRWFCFHPDPLFLCCACSPVRALSVGPSSPCVLLFVQPVLFHRSTKLSFCAWRTHCLSPFRSFPFCVQFAFRETRTTSLPRVRNVNSKRAAFLCRVARGIVQAFLLA